MDQRIISMLKNEIGGMIRSDHKVPEKLHV